MPYGQPLPKTPGPDARRASRSPSAAYWGQQRPMAPRNEAEAGAQARYALWRFAGKTRLRGVRRDQAAISLVRNRFKAARVFTDAQLAAVLREPQDGACSWDALRVLTAAADEPMPTEPTAGLVALLGQPCTRCKAAFAEGKVLERERRLLASGLRRRVTGPQPPSYYTPNPRRLPKA